MNNALIRRRRGDKKVADVMLFHGNGYTVKEIQEFTSFSYSSIIQILWRRGISPNKYIRKSTKSLDHNYFEKVDTPIKAYFFGLLCADGCVQPKWSRVSIALGIQDKYIIEELKKELKSDTPITEYKCRVGNGYACCIQVYSKKLVEDLISIGCGVKKSLSLKMPTISNELFWHFLRGFFDGDGCVGKQGELFKITSTLSFVITLKDIFKRELNIYSGISKGVNCYHLRVGKRESLNKIRDLLYKDADVYLCRKLNRFMKGEYSVKRKTKQMMLAEKTEINAN